ncbi:MULTISPECIES: helix-turn-helix domain-containing protein [Pseudonocardia]|uniref:Transcriptional activator FeaR n=2 Tax=Pseudonocardia TaxID=1847 RepID=A0A1Y2MIL5_PSEAH|nr:MULTISPECIES: helix-turn-helix domain-containing protein [Pseudonocardia]OSY34911.1 Transcriptional activator FeaR [Pseudonocardia autotrophica]TDN76974.1 AraC-like DNA-binding protein [Pseudonocardia autotrophica]BBG00978.1 transcriptional regulator FeaR [Pseudonocardia autotrophica]GEC29119.1 transcriptional regulator FeaR [Pseudonocardia saturnea]
MYRIDSLTTSTDRRRQRAEKDAWREWCNHVHGAIDVGLGTDHYNGAVTRQQTSRYQLVSWRADTERLTRHRRHVRADPRGVFEFVVPLRGSLYLGEDEPGATTLAPGSIAMVPIDQRLSFAHGDGSVALSMIVPYERVEHRFGLPVAAGIIRSDSGIAKVGRDLLVGLVRQRDSLTAADFDTACEHATDLICRGLSGDPQPVDAAGTDLIHEQVLRYVREHATDPQLTVRSLAVALGWSRRHIQAVLARRGTTAIDLIRNERLDLARSRLASPRFAGRTIASIAHSVGFTSPSAFSHAFRQRFGCPPRDVRR